MVSEVVGSTGLGDRWAVLLPSYLLCNQLGYTTVGVAVEVGILSCLVLDLQLERHLDYMNRPHSRSQYTKLQPLGLGALLLHIESHASSPDGR